MTIAAFVPDDFRARYPMFTCASDALLSAFFDEAGLYLANTDCSPVQNIAKRTQLLWMLTAHIAYLNGALSPDGSMPPVGRVSSASEGSVSASMEYAAPGTAAWLTQSQWGAAFWQATAYLRSFRYRPQATRVEGLNGRYGRW